ncbi:peptidoglycan-binding domain-containing protein [Argonema antarcticum]|uniref:peptidoglycan-binding domain-containing protein n=1 Tax=Argonema antarcticum TaxID=2942763 RepID=UPI00201173D9|nr:peptidoglycan-binding protein [Argonema antarcticum]MCL1473910.1 peptidoglycan-binding protein [Argonema antarcticum A004/B2]
MTENQKGLKPTTFIPFSTFWGLIQNPKSKIQNRLKSRFYSFLFAISLLSWQQIQPALSQGVSRLESEVKGPQSLVRPILKSGSQGVAVSELQAALKLLGYYSGSVDGTYSESTAIAVSRFQRAAGLNVDGIVGTATWERLFPLTPPKPSSPPSASSPESPTNASPATAAEPPGTDLPTLKLGMRGPAVFWLQKRLQATGFFTGNVDGIFGSDTEIAVKAAQRNYRLNPDGIVGGSTWRALLP